MKKLCIALIALIWVGTMVQAQTATEVLNNDMDITFFGLDYSKAKGVMLGASAGEVVKKYIPAINQLLIKEAKKYNVAGALNKTNVAYDFTAVNRLNAEIDTNSFIIFETSPKYSITENEVAEMVKKYNIEEKKGIGLVFLVELMDKFNGRAVYRLVFFSMPDGRIIVDKKVTGTPQGIGFRNFWANSFYSALKTDVKALAGSKY